MADKQRRLEAIRAAKAALEAEAQPIRPTRRTRADPARRRACAGRAGRKRGEDGGPPDRAQRNFTDPDSRILPTRDGFVQGYNGQIAVDAAHQVIVAHRLADQLGRLSRPRAARRQPAGPSRPQAAGGLRRRRLCHRGEPRRAEGAPDQGLSAAGPSASRRGALLPAARQADQDAPDERHGRDAEAGRPTEAATGCESRWSSPSSGRSSRPEASGSSCCEASIRSEPSGR